ncbi:MAG: ThiF family adenylyltransferase [Saprospiraceae bacterium]|nr:ThiF family adenylyltransferase [Saprospiraceae bacterium]
MSDFFTTQERARYARHFTLPEFGEEGQRKLKQSSVLVIGAGGLGSPLLLYLAAAGVGRIGIVEFDQVDESNLQRQVLYTIGDLGQSKGEVAVRRLRALNPLVEVEHYPTRLSSENALSIFRGYDLVADGTDNFPTRYLVNDACVLSGIPNVYASIFRFEGQVSVFNLLRADGARGPNYRSLFPQPPPPGMVPSCAEGGVLGVLPGIVGSLQASEAIKVLTGIGDPLDGRLFLFDAASFSSRILKIPDTPGPAITELIDYEEFCGLAPSAPVKEIGVQEFFEMRERGVDFQLIDVREPYEVEIAELGGELIPPAEIERSADRIARDKMVVLHCRSGRRSADAVRLLEERFGFDNLYNLRGGILAWADEIDPSMAKY